MKRFIATGALAICVMGLWVYWQEIISKTHRQSEEFLKQAGTELPLLPHLHNSNVSAVKILRSGKPTIYVVRGSDGKWSMQLPETLPADGYQIERLLGSLQQLTIIRRLPHDLTLSDGFGLRDPSVVVELMSNQALQRLLIGNEAPVGDGLFIGLNDKTNIVLVAKEPLTKLPQSPAELVDRHPVPLMRDPLHTIKVQYLGNSLLMRSGGEGWQIESPIRTPADQRVMMEWLSHLTSYEAPVVFAGDRATNARFRSQGILQLAAGNVFHSLEVGRVGTKLIGRRSDKPDLYYEVGEEELVWLFPQASRLYDKHIVHMASNEIAAAELHHAGKSMRIERSADGWMWHGGLLPQPQAEEFLQWIRELELAETSEMVGDLKQCRAVSSPEWHVGLEHRLGHPSTQLILTRTPGCGDVATIRSRFRAKLADTAVIDRLQVIFLFMPPLHAISSS